MRLGVLGGLALTGPSGALHLESTKTGALLAYLALAPGEHSRAKLQGMLWSELSDEKAARNLRHALWDLRRTLATCGVDPIVAGRTCVAFAPNGAVAVDALTVLAARDDRSGEGEAAEILGAAADLYRGDLLDGVFVNDAPEFEEWLVAERERLRVAACDMLRRLVALYRQRGDLMAALARARSLVALDPWREESHRQVMELLTLAGEPAAALAQFEECRQILAQHLQTTPTAETTRLAERIRTSTGVVTSQEPPLMRHNLPAQATPFVGRQGELEAIERLLVEPDCRLVCLLGPGGIGKTRLALQIGRRQVLAGADRRVFANGVWFVPPCENAGAGGLAAAIARAMSLGGQGLPGVPAAEERLLDYLRNQNALLIIDGFEHVLHDAGPLAALLAAAPQLKALVTSRERLHAEGEWVVEVGGLAVPSGAARDIRRSAAVQLFVQSARRARFGFDPTPEELVGVATVCQIIEGSPLGIELAAGWVGSLTVREIAAEIERHPGFLAGRDGGLTAVFASSWARLAEAERAALAALSVFVGGCSREAAEVVAGASLAIMRRLVDSSFVRHEASGRFTIHEVLRRFARDELERDAGDLERVRAAHAEFVAARCRILEARVRGAGQREVLDEIAVEIDNLQGAWRWAVSTSAGDVIAGCLDSLQAFAELRGWLRGGEMLVSEAIAAFRHSDRELRARLLAARGSIRNRMGAYEAAAADLERAIDLAAGSREVHAAALAHLGEAACLQGRYPEARRHLERALAVGTELRIRSMGSGLLGRVALEEGRHDDAEAAFDTALALAREAGDTSRVRWAMNQLGLMAYFRGDLDRSGRLFEEALALARAASDMALVKEAATGLGYIHEDRGEFAAARERYEEALAMSNEMGDRRGEAQALMVIGETFRRTGAADRARASYEAALTIAKELGSVYLIGLLTGNLAYLAAAAGEPGEAGARIRETLELYRTGGPVAIVLPAVTSAAEVLHARGESRRALALLGLVLTHPANRQDHRVEAERVLATIRRTIDGDDIVRGLEDGQRLELDAVVADLLSDT